MVLNILYPDKLKISLGDDLIYIAFTLWYATELMFNTSLKSIVGIDIKVFNDIVSWLVLMMLMVQIVFFQRYSLKSLIVISCITAFVIISILISGSRFILSTWIFIVASKNINMDRLIRTARNILLVGILIVLLSFSMGLLEDVITYRGDIVRHSMGFSHPNQLGLRVFQFVICTLYLDRERLRFRNFIIIVAAAVFCYLVPNSKSATMMLFLLLLLIIFYKIIRLINKNRGLFYSRILIFGMITVNLMSIILSTTGLLRNEFFSRFDKIISTRFSESYRVFQLYGIKLLGNLIYVTDKERQIAQIPYKLWLDNSYMFMLLRYGVITFLLFSLFYLIGALYFEKNGENILVIVFFLYSIYGIMETGMFMVQHNVFLLSLGLVLYDKSLIFSHELHAK